MGDPQLIEKPKKEKKAKAPKRLYPADFDGLTPPTSLWKQRRFGTKQYTLRSKKVVTGVLHLPGVGNGVTPKIMFLAPSALEEEASDFYASKPGLLRGPAANLFLRCVRRVGFKDTDWYYTTLCKYPVKKMKPTASDIRWNQAMLEDEIAVLKPQIIVCLGKPPFDFLFKVKLKLAEIQGGFFSSEKYGCIIFPMDSITTPLYKPEHLERFLVDLRELKREFGTLTGKPVIKVETNYMIIEKAVQLNNLMQEFKTRIDAGKLHSMAVDCEWHGQTAWSGTLRSLQLCWKPGVAAYVKFTSPVEGKSVYVMDQPLNIIQTILDPLRDPRLKFIGHYLAADGVWMEQHLDIPMYGRAGFDTMFAAQNLNEYSDLKLERNAVKYTDLGRYDIKLLLWKKANKFTGDVDGGYGLVPDKILIDYALRDVDCTMRIYPYLLKQLQQQQLVDYYFDICLPFVTDGFMEMMRCGLPIDVPYLETMRDTFTRNRTMLLDDFRQELYQEACTMFRAALEAINPDGRDIYRDLDSCMRDPAAGPEAQTAVFDRLKDFVGPKLLPKFLDIYQHWRDALQFNVDSPDQVRRWLFEIKGFTPLKTTKRDGIQMAWERVLSFPLEKQITFTPAADKQTIKVLAANDKLVAQLEGLKSVGNIVKTFLGEPETEE